MDSPIGQLFTRQQIASLVGVSNDLLGYWMREDLLVPSSGGEGRGSHRRFDFVQVNIAAIYGQLRRFGLNISSLRSLADLLQSAAKLGASCELHPSNYSSAAYLATTLHRFRTGGEVLVSAHSLGEKAPDDLRGRAYSDWLMAKKPAESEREIVEHLIGQRSDYDSIGAIVAAAETFGPNKETEARVYADLVYGVRAPGYADSYSWLLALQPGEACRIEFGFDGAKFFDTVTAGSPEAFGPGIFLPVSGIIREIWGLKNYSEYRREREQDYIVGKLEAAGIKATVVVHDDEEQSFSIDHPGTERSAVAAALKGTRYEFGPEEPQA